MAARALFLIAAVSLACAAQAAEWQTGIATFTGVDDQASRSVPNGACGYGELSSEMYPGLPLAGVSFDIGVFKDKALKGCGTCVELKCVDEVCNDPKKVLTVMVYDTCDKDKCASNQINLQALPFKSLAPLDIGRIAVQFREVPCRFNGGVVVNVDRFRASAGGWSRLLFKNVNGAPLNKVEFSPAGVEAWRPMSNNFGAAWEASRLPELPWDIKLTNADGQSIVLKSAVTSDKTGDFVSSNNFLPAGTGDAPKEQPKQPEAPVTQQPQQPEAPKEQPKQPETPKEQPKQPEAPVTQQPQQPEAPKEQPKQPETPVTQQPQQPEAPKEQPKQPETPKEQPKQPEAPVTQQPQKPEAPKEQPKQPEQKEEKRQETPKKEEEKPAATKQDAPRADDKQSGAAKDAVEQKKDAPTTLDAPKSAELKKDAPTALKADAPKTAAPTAAAPAATAPASPKADAPKVAADEQQPHKDDKPAAVSPPVKAAAATTAQPSKKPKGDLLAMLLQKDNIKA